MPEIKALLKGYNSFFQKYFTHDTELYSKLSEVGQSPPTLVIACSDSRVDPSIITSSDPGDIFVIRNVANMVPPYDDSSSGLHGVSAAVEFAVKMVQVKHIVVLGHSQCAGINALLNSEHIPATDFISDWVKMGEPAKAKTIARIPEDQPEARQQCCEKESILHSLENLLSFPWIKKRVEGGELKLHGWYFELRNGSLQQFNAEQGEFVAVDTDNNVA